MNLYRVMPFRRLQQVAEQACLAFVSYRKFADDPHEASLLRALTTADGTKDVFRVLKAEREQHKLPMLNLGARCADTTAFLQSWTKTPEHNLMWDRYAEEVDENGQVTYRNAVRVTMTEGGRQNLPDFISAIDVRYEPEFDMLKELRLVDKGNFMDFRHSLLFKLDAYAHENEVRLMTPIFNDMNSAIAGRPVLAPWWNNPRGDKDVTLVQIGALKNIIASVMTGPRADDQLQRDVEEFCKKCQVAYEGKSQLQTPRYKGSTKIFKSDPG